MSTPQNAPRRRKQKARRTRKLARWRELRAVRTSDGLVDEAAATALGSQRLAGLQRAAFEPSLADSIKDIAPDLRQRLVALLVANPDVAKHFHEEIDDVFEGIARRLEFPGGEHVRDDQLERLQERVTDAARRLRITPVEGVVIGPLHTRSIDAFSDTLFGAANIVGVHVPLLVFAYLVAKATAAFPLARSPFEDSVGGDTVVVPAALYQVGLRWLTQLVFAVVVDRDPIGQPPYSPPRGWPFWPVAIAWVEGIEFFCVAHEYAHLLHAQGQRASDELKAARLLLDGESTDDPITSELAADRFGLAASWASASRDEDDHDLSAYGPLVFLWFLDRIEGVGHPMHGDAHPPAAIRLARAEEMFPTDLSAATWSVMKRRLDAAWSIAARAAGVLR